MSTPQFLSVDQPLVPYVVQYLRAFEEKKYLTALVILPTRRAVKEVARALLENAATASIILPRLMAVSDLDVPNIPPALGETKRTGLMLKILKEMEGVFSLDLLPFLTAFLDDRHTHGVDLARLETLVPEVYAEHWQKTSIFFKTFLDRWESLRLENGWIEAAERRTLVMKELCHQWQETPPTHPILVAGVDGFVPAVKDLMACVLQVPSGTVMINGFLPDIKGKKENLLSTHPNFLAGSFDGNHSPLVSSDRSIIVAHLMSSLAFEDRDPATFSFAGMYLLESLTLAQEAQSIAVLARRHLEKPSGVLAIITPDSELAEKIQCALGRWNIRVDLAEGQSLAHHPLGRFVLESLFLEAPSKDAALFLSILKSPFATLGYETPYALKKSVRRFEKDVLRQKPGYQRVDSEGVTTLMARFDAVTTAFFTLKMHATEHPLKTWLACHCQMLERLSTLLWASEEGEIVARCLRDLLEHHSDYPPLSLKDYHALLQQRLAQETLREAVNHPRVKIVNPLQGAYMCYDVGILCGLTEGVWPQHPKSNPWFNRDMSLLLGLPDEQVLIGRAASILAQNMMTPTVVLSYAHRRGGDPAAPSRWVLRLKALAEKQGNLANLRLSDSLLSWGNRLDQPIERICLTPPHVTPPVERRPRRFSISDVERFFRDPYQIYAKFCLGLEPLKPLNEPLGAADFGTFVHKVLEQAVKEAGHEHPPILSVWRERLMPTPMPEDQVFLWRRAFEEMTPWLEGYLKAQQQQSLETLVEDKMSTRFECDGEIFELVGKADRIDRLMDGTYEIIDYKTGRVPLKRDFLEGDAPQLPLLAYLFERLHPQAHVSKLTYVNVTERTVHSFSRAKIVEDVIERLRQTFGYYLNQANGYVINPYGALSNTFNDYAHLERTAEWLENGGEARR